MGKPKYLIEAQGELSEKLVILALNRAHEHAYLRDFEALNRTVRRRLEAKLGRRVEPHLGGPRDYEDFELFNEIDGMHFGMRLSIHCPDSIFIRMGFDPLPGRKTEAPPREKITLYTYVTKFEGRPIYRHFRSNCIRGKNSIILDLNRRLKIRPEIYDFGSY